MKTTKSNNHSFDIFDNLLEGCQIVNFDWIYVYLNSAVNKQRQKTKKQLLNHSILEVYPGIEKTEYFKTLQNCMINRKPLQLLNDYILPDASRGWFELSIQPVPQGILIFSNDITELVCANEEVKKQVKKLRALREIDLAILGTTDLMVALKTILREINSQLKVDAADVLLLNPHTQTLEYSIGYGFNSNVIKTAKIRIGEYYAGRAALENKSFYVNDLSVTDKDSIDADLIKNEGFILYYVIPLVAKGAINGVFEIYHRSLINPPLGWIDIFEELVGQASMAVDNSILFNKLNRANLDLLLAYNETIEGWSRALDLRDKETEGHSLRVTEMTLNLAHHFDFSETEIANLRYGALLHDIGKMGVSDSILLKPEKLTADEFIKIQKHTTYAYELLFPIKHLRQSIEIPYCHHEKWDGTGYPRGLIGEQIPLSARLFAIVDVWDALRSDRPYRKGWPKEKTVEHISSLSGTHFDPHVVEIFIKANF